MAAFATNVMRVRNRMDLAAALGKAIAVHERKPLLNALISAEVPAGAVNRIDEALSTGAAGAMVNEAVIDGQPTRRIRGNAFRIEPY
jgi:crotonobetainyl-CoA:carnitine CoA-transferase CaiB-like acyl-CoA transferase